ncbi:hypothetical protein ABGV43_03930 [Paenibacillus amylolyticus]
MQNVRDLFYHRKGSSIPQYRKHFECYSVMAARFMDAHEAVQYLLDFVESFKHPEEKRYLIEIYLEV